MNRICCLVWSNVRKEGNFNWKTEAIQAVSGVPLPETNLREIYVSRLWPERGA